MKRLYQLLKLAGFLFLNILLCADMASGQLSVNPTSISFGSVQTGTSSAQPVNLANSGNSDLTISQAGLTGKGFSLSGPALPLTLKAGQSAMFNVTFAPASSGGASGTFSLVTSTISKHDHSGKHNSTTSATTGVSLSGSGAAVSPAIATPGVLAVNPGVLNFAGVQAGSSQSLSAALTNSGQSTVTVAQAATTSNSFILNGLSLPMGLAAGQSVTFSVTFAPVSAGSASGSLSISSDAATPTLTVALAGAGLAPGQLSVTPPSADFGNVTVGTSKTQSGTLTASGSSVTLSSASVSDSEFSLSGLAFPVTIPAGQSLPFTLNFTPRASGAAGAVLSFASNAAAAAAENLSGTGVAPPQHNVSLSWDTVSAVTGYNVYRGSQSGGPYTKINPVLDAGTDYVDSSIQGGQNYYYVTTAVDSTGGQSPYSNEIQVAIPSP
ncbi:MAG: choice-of-anchor D domain-containing protein [Terriglobales bacterium]